MKRILTSLFIAAVAIGYASSALALSFSADVPVQYTWADRFINAQKDVKAKEQAATNTSGYLLTLTHGFLGVGYEDYEVKSKAIAQSPFGATPFDIALHFQMYDVVLDLPLPIVHLMLGYGQGRVNARLGGGPAGQLPPIQGADVSQSFLRLGIPIGPVFDVHVGYHIVTAQDAKVVQSGAQDSVKPSGSLVTAGVRLGW